MAVLVASFALRSGPGRVCLQLQDDGDLPRGGVYFTGPQDDRGLAPRFDELFQDAALKSQAGLGERLSELLERARDLARQAVPRLTPEVLEGLLALQAEAAALEAAQADDESPVPGAFRLEELILGSALIFVSEEERYPRPRYQGSDLALGRFRTALGAPP